MRRAVPPLPQYVFMTWCLVKHRDNFTFTLFYTLCDNKTNIQVSTYGVFVGKPEGKRPLERPRRRWKDNIRKDLREMGWEDVDWMYLTEGRNQWMSVVNTLMNLRFP
jgi:hypothetical protein